MVLMVLIRAACGCEEGVLVTCSFVVPNLYLAWAIFNIELVSDSVV